MVYYHNRRRSSIHVVAEASLGFRVGISARHSSDEKRSSETSSRSKQRKINDKIKAPTHPCYLRIVAPEPPHLALTNDKAKNPPSAHVHHRIVLPEPSPSDDRYTTLHAFCLATDVTYARLSERLERLRNQEADLKLRLRAHGGSNASWESWELIQNDVSKLEQTLKDMRQKIEEQRGEWDGKGDVFMVGGRWAAFL